jgi:hypothetical protein
MKKLLFAAAMFLTVAAVAGCDKDPVTTPVEKTFEITPGETSVEFGFNETRDITFDVTGDGATDLTLKVTVPDGWDYRTTNFARNEDKTGYSGTIRVTAPMTESSGDMEISVVNGEEKEKAAVVKVSATADPLKVGIDISGETLLLGLSEGRSVPFTVTRNNPVKLTAEVSATNSWNVKLEGFATENEADITKSYSGSILITAPGEKSSTEITVNIKNAAGDVVASAKLNAECDKVIDVRLDLPVKNMNFKFSETRTTEFTVKGKDAKALTAAVEPSGNWTASVTSFGEGADGYAGVISITSPATEAIGTVVLTVTNGTDINLSETINVSSTPFSLQFEEDKYEFAIKQVRVVNYTVTGTGGDIMKGATPIYPEGWILDPDPEMPKPSFVWDEAQGRYNGSFRLLSSNFPENSVVYVRLIDNSDRTIDYPVDVICAGGTPVPAPKLGANCIVVSQAGAVSFDARKGDGTTVSGSTVKWIWADRANLIDENSLSYASGKISFNTPASFTPGNMLVGLFDSAGKIVWTWHIWFVAGLNLNAAPGEFLNMPLGATASTRTAGVEDFGLLYQWGRKEPFPGPRERKGGREEVNTAFSGNTRDFVMATGYSWGTVIESVETHDKAAQLPTKMVVMSKNLPSAGSAPWGPVSDPCPKGWRVPTHKELWAHWDFYNSTGPMGSEAHTGFADEGRIPNSYPDEWWGSSGSRMTDSGLTNWSGALRMDGYLYYWSSTSTARNSAKDPEENLGDEGYLYAAVIDSGYNMWVSGTDWKKCHSAAVRCIKE